MGQFLCSEDEFSDYSASNDKKIKKKKLQDIDKLEEEPVEVIQTELNFSKFGSNEVFGSFNDEKINEICLTNTQKIRSLNLGWNQITSTGIFYFSKSNWNNLALLQLWCNKIGDKGCMILTRVKLQKLQVLGLNHNKISDSGILHLSKKQWKFLERLDLGDNFLSKGTKWIAKSNFINRINISLKSNNIRYQEIQYLMLAEYNPIYIELGGNQTVKNQNKHLYLRKLLMKRFKHDWII